MSKISHKIRTKDSNNLKSQTKRKINSSKKK